MSSRRRSGQPRSPTGNRSAKIAPPLAPPLAAPDAVLPDPAPTEPVAAPQDGPPVAQALLSSVSIDAVEAASEPAPAPVPDLEPSAASAGSVVAAEDSAVVPQTVGDAAPEAPADAAPPGIPNAEASDGESADALVVPVPPAQAGQGTRRPIGFQPPSLAPLTEINATLTAFVRGESAAAIAHLGALTRAGSPAEAIRLQVGEIQRAADASLTCFSAIVRSAHRFADAARTP